MEHKVKNTKNLDLLINAAEDLIIENNTIKGVILRDQTKLFANAVVITTGTYLKANILLGHDKKVSGPNGEMTTSGISQALKKIGLDLFRFKTGTPPRVYQDSVDLTKASPEPGTNAKLAFSSSTKTFKPVNEQVLCYLIHSTAETKKIIEQNLEKSASEPVLKLLNSAIANAVNNNGMDADKLYVKQTYVNEGPTLKRFRPRAHGRAYEILKRTSHITIVVSDNK